MKKFRKVFVTEPAHDVTKLKDYAEDIRFLTSGYEPYNELFELVLRALYDFNPLTDAILLMGRSMANAMVGLVIGENYSESPYSFLIYNNGDYQVVEVP